MEKSRFPWIKDKYSLGLIGILLIFAIIKISQIGFKFSDENIYFYMGKLMLQGQLPYRDFFFASPPLQIIIITSFLGLIGSKVLLLKLLPIFATITSSIFVFKIAKKATSSSYGLIASILYLFSFVVLTTTDHSTGVHLTTMFFIISLYLTSRQRFFLAGIFSAFSLLTRLYSAFAIIGIMLYLLIKNRKGLFKFISGLALTFIPANILLLIFFGKNYINSVFLYHFLKSQGISKLKIFSFFIRWDFIPVILSILAIPLKNKRKIALPLVAGTTISLFYLFYTDIYYLYLGLLVPTLAIIGSWTLYSFSKKIPRRIFVPILIIFLGFVMINNTIFYLKDHAPTAKIDFIQDLTEYIEKNSKPNETIYGSFEITPLVALLSEREITGNYVDTNEKTFLTGMYDINQRTNEINQSTKFVIMKALLDSRGYIIAMDNIIDGKVLLKECKIKKIYPVKRDYEDNAVLVFDCKD